MSFKLESIAQKYGDRDYLSHNVKGATAADDRALFGMRVSSFGIINFGYMSQGEKKSFKPIDKGIEVDIQLVSVYAFTTSATADEITLKLFSGSSEIAEQKISNNEMPYTFPPGAIINPNLTIEATARYTTSQLVLYWQPVHVLDYVEV